MPNASEIETIGRLLQSLPSDLKLTDFHLNWVGETHTQYHACVGNLAIEFFFRYDNKPDWFDIKYTRYGVEYASQYQKWADLSEWEPTIEQFIVDYVK